jgi:hypothetical protein
MLEHSCELVEVESCSDGGDQRDGTVVEIREKGRWWRSERWGDGGGQRGGAMVEVREVGR